MWVKSCWMAFSYLVAFGNRIPVWSSFRSKYVPRAILFRAKLRGYSGFRWTAAQQWFWTWIGMCRILHDWVVHSVRCLFFGIVHPARCKLLRFATGYPNFGDCMKVIRFITTVICLPFWSTRHLEPRYPSALNRRQGVSSRSHTENSLTLEASTRRTVYPSQRLLVVPVRAKNII